MTRPISCRERIDTVLAGRTPDRTPVLGGWISCPSYLADLAGTDEDAFWADPVGVSMRAYEVLGTDGLISLTVPRRRDDFRIVDADTYAKADRGESLDDAVERVGRMPSAEQVEADFDFEREYAAYRRDLLQMQDRAGEMVWMPAHWGAGAKVTWYGDFGYENFFYLVGLYPDRARKLLEVGGAQGRCQSRLVARAVTEGLYPRAVLLGEDICTQRGPMLSPAFLERHYAPQLRRGLEPLLEAGCKPVWHCDGDVRPMLDMLLDCGVQGFQGFQPECGMTLEGIVDRRTRDGDPLVVFGPLSVTTELPVLAPGEVRQAVRRAIDLCRDRAHLVLFTANTINPDVPLDNIRAMYEAVRQ